MRLVQKSLKHTGYAVLKILTNSSNYFKIAPLFTNDYLIEGNEVKKEVQKLGINASLIGIYAVDLMCPLHDLREFKQKYNALPRNYVEEIRTGFSNASGLTQSLPRFVYK